MDILTAALFCIAACVLIKPLAGVASEVKLVCSVAAACLITLRFLDSWREISAALEDIFLQTGMQSEYLKIILKSLGICFVTQLGCDCCRDSGENAMASQLELAGKAAILVTALPLFSAAAEMVRTLLMI